MAKYIVMIKDEVGEVMRAHGSQALEKEYSYPDVDWDNELETEVFYAWQYELECRLQEEWEKIYGPECQVFLERKFSDMSLADWARLDYNTDLF